MSNEEKFRSEFLDHLISNGFSKSEFTPEPNMQHGKTDDTKMVTRVTIGGKRLCLITTKGFMMESCAECVAEIIKVKSDEFPGILPNNAEVPIWLCSGDHQFGFDGGCNKIIAAH